MYVVVVFYLGKMGFNGPCGAHIKSESSSTMLKCFLDARKKIVSFHPASFILICGHTMSSLIGEATPVQHSCKFLYTNALLNQVNFLLHPPQLASCASLLFGAERPENRGLTGVFQ